MPEISRFLGIIIYMYFDEHPPPHFHAKYGSYEILVYLDDGAVEGRFPRRALRHVLKRFAFYCTGYPQCTNQPRMSATVIVSSACLIASISASTARALARRHHVLLFDPHGSRGVQSGA